MRAVVRLAVVVFRAVLRPPDADFFAVVLRVRDGDFRAPLFRLRDFDADRLAAPRPEPLFLPPPVVLLTVAQARASAVSAETPRFL